ncbi:pyridoxamine 5'-phosphate oxidase family protein [Actinomadura sp. ATCC 31491]|uniref:Pyridoxamine 5'-phosphate oxidase family protein n=1 Tax=Actinomadura luzonensis TaxID=2805427 RepID=A0ABT0FIU9_9ACTN|nr:pyridoxamine 5'-phosphate oxidase family protein [Actinomadura luzonensis]MCK2212230.1 pyridoxamine 5'-phosphate oxidase family protein [Actinomadura luzonensis]
MSVTTTTQGPRLTAEQVWRELGRQSFATVAHLTPDGQPRSSGVVYVTGGRRLYVAVAADSWKARHLARSGRVAVTVPVHRGGLLALLAPIPPATVSFHGTAIVHPGIPDPDGDVWRRLRRLLPEERRETCRVVEIRPEGAFLTYGLGVPLMAMRRPALASARVPIP